MKSIEDIKDRLHRLDEDASLLFDGDDRFICIIVGGSALILLGYLTRATHDIDMLRTPSELLELLGKYDMNTNVSAHMDNFPDDYSERVHKLDLPTQKIDFYTLSLEDLVISKLAAWRGKDEQDITRDVVLLAIDWDQLAKSAEMVRMGILSDRARGEFNLRYEEYVEKYHHA